MSNIKNELKILLIEKEMTMTELVDMLNNKYERNDSVQNLNNKLSKGTIRYNEILEIAEVLDYKLAWIPNDIRMDAGRNGIFYSSDPDKIKHKQQGKERTKLVRKANKDISLIPISRDEFEKEAYKLIKRLEDE